MTIHAWSLYTYCQPRLTMVSTQKWDKGITAISAWPFFVVPFPPSQPLPSWPETMQLQFQWPTSQTQSSETTVLAVTFLTPFSSPSSLLPHHHQAGSWLFLHLEASDWIILKLGDAATLETFWHSVNVFKKWFLTSSEKPIKTPNSLACFPKKLKKWSGIKQQQQQQQHQPQPQQHQPQPQQQQQQHQPQPQQHQPQPQQQQQQQKTIVHVTFAFGTLPRHMATVPPQGHQTPHHWRRG